MPAHPARFGVALLLNLVAQQEVLPSRFSLMAFNVCSTALEAPTGAAFTNATPGRGEPAFQ